MIIYFVFIIRNKCTYGATRSRLPKMFCTILFIYRGSTTYKKCCQTLCIWDLAFRHIRRVRIHTHIYIYICINDAIRDKSRNPHVRCIPRETMERFLSPYPVPTAGIPSGLDASRVVVLVGCAVKCVCRGVMVYIYIIYGLCILALG